MNKCEQSDMILTKKGEEGNEWTIEESCRIQAI